MLKYVFSKNKKLNNKGMTLTELVVAFALLSLFLVAATQMISYTINIYYQSKGISYGLEVSNMISEKIIGQLEGASQKHSVSLTDEEEETPSSNPIVDRGSSAAGDSIKFCDETGSIVTISVDANGYMNVHYDEVTTGSVAYDAVDWKFDSKAYMGYTVSVLRFENPGPEYPPNVLKMVLVLSSDRYGDYTTNYYIKCTNVEEIRGL